MATKIQINIDLAKIPAGAIKDYHRNEGGDSRYTYLDVALMKQPDDRGNAYSVSVYCNGERTYIGKGKEVTFGEGTSTQVPTPARRESAPKFTPADLQSDDNDLPFDK